MKGNSRVLIIVFLMLSISLCSLYLFLPSYFDSIDNRVRDIYFMLRGEQKASEDIVIIDIDEKSISELGQWPWERDKVATLLSNLTDLEAGIIGLDIVFSEPDKTSPTIIADLLGLDRKDLPDYDEKLSKAILSTPSILGYVFSFNKNDTNEAPQVPAIFIEKNLQKRDYLPVAKGVLTNLQIIQDSGYSSGYLNNIPDGDGIIRSIPLLVKYDDSLYSSLSFEMYRIALGAKKVKVTYSEAGVEKVDVGSQNIPIDRFGRLYVNFRGYFKSYKYISAVDIINNKIKKEEIQGKFVLVGTSAYGLMDLRITPMENVMPGVEIHANIIDNLINSNMLHKSSWVELIDLCMIIIICFMIIFVFTRFSFVFFVFSCTLTLFGIIYLNYYLLFTKYIIINTSFPILSMVISLTLALGLKFLYEYSQKQMIKSIFSKKVSKDVMEDLLLNESDIMSAKEREVSVLFSDIRGFTSISEKLNDPNKLIDFLNIYMTPMTDIITKNEGTVDKFIGDAIMAYWNAPSDVKDHADMALLSAIEQIKRLEKVNEEFISLGYPSIDIGIGINTGLAVVGEMGSVGRSDYTIIGDSVNLGSRTEGLCKNYKAQILITEFTKDNLNKEYNIEFLDEVKVKGKDESVKIYKVIP